MKKLKLITKIIVNAIIGIIIIFLGCIITFEFTKSNILGIWEEINSHMYYTFFDDNYVNISAVDKEGNGMILEAPYKEKKDKIFIHIFNDSIIWKIQNINKKQMNIIDSANDTLYFEKRGNNVIDYTPFPIGKNRRLIFGTWYINEYKEYLTIFRNKKCCISNEKELFSLNFDFPETSKIIIKIEDAKKNIRYIFDYQDIKENTCKVNIIKDDRIEKVTLTKFSDIGIWEPTENFE